MVTPLSSMGSATRITWFVAEHTSHCGWTTYLGVFGNLGVVPTSPSPHTFPRARSPELLRLQKLVLLLAIPKLVVEELLGRMCPGAQREINALLSCVLGLLLRRRYSTVEMKLARHSFDHSFVLLAELVSRACEALGWGAVRKIVDYVSDRTSFFSNTLCLSNSRESARTSGRARISHPLAPHIYRAVTTQNSNLYSSTYSTAR